MEKLKIIFLGTSQAIPTISRNHTSILLSYKNENILIDCGEGTQRQLRKVGVNPCKITRLLITHWHGDHVLGIPGLFQTLTLNNYSKTICIYGPKGTKKLIKNILRIFIQQEKIKFEVREVNGKFFETNNFLLNAISLKHGVPTNGYSFQEKDKFRINKKKLNKLNIGKEKEKLSELSKGNDIKIDNQLIKAEKLTYLEKGRKISFVFDTELCNNAEKLSENSDLAIIEATYSKEQEDLAKKHKHLTAEQAAKIARKAKAKKLILTHISQRYEFKEKNLLKEARKIFPKTEIAKDLMTVEINYSERPKSFPK